MNFTETSIEELSAQVERAEQEAASRTERKEVAALRQLADRIITITRPKVYCAPHEFTPVVDPKRTCCVKCHYPEEHKVHGSSS